MPLYVLQLSQMRRRLRYRSNDGIFAAAIAFLIFVIILWRLAL